MASLNLRKVDEKLKNELKSEAALSGENLEEYCVHILEKRGKVVQGAGSDIKTAPEKKSRSFGVAAGGADGAPDDRGISSGRGASSEAPEGSASPNTTTLTEWDEVEAAREKERHESLVAPPSHSPVSISIPDKWPWDKMGASPLQNPDDRRDPPSDFQQLLDKAKETANCPDCRKAAKHAYSDATTPGFFYDTCEKHRTPSISTTHFASLNPGPHLLKDRKGNTAWCGGPSLCKFCDDGVPPTGDHQAKQVEEIDPRHYAGFSTTQEMSIEEAKKRFPGFSEGTRIDAAFSGEPKNMEPFRPAPSPVIFTSPDNYPWDGFGEKPHPDETPKPISSTPENLEAVTDLGIRPSEEFDLPWSESPEIPEGAIDGSQTTETNPDVEAVGTGKKGNRAESLQPRDQGGGKAGRKIRGVRQPESGRRDPDPTQAISKVVNSKEDVTRLLTPMKNLKGCSECGGVNGMHQKGCKKGK